MFTKTTVLAAFAVTGSLIAGLAAAKDHNVTVAVPVNAQGLDLTQPQDARTFYARLQQAAYVVCTDGKRVDLTPADNQKSCYEKALGKDRYELLVTHNFLIGWLVSQAVNGPPWRWLGLNQMNCAVTIIAYQPVLPPSLILFNDAGHLPHALRWTGFPPSLRPAGT